MTSPDNISYFQSIQWNQSKAKYQSIITHIKEGIKNRQLQGLLPSSRVLADLLQLNRNTITKALEELVWEGWLISHPKKGLSVNTMQQQTVKAASIQQYKLPYKLKQIQLINNRLATSINLDQQFAIYNAKLLKEKKSKYSLQQLQHWLHYRYRWTMPVSHIHIVRNQFDCQYILSRIILNNNDRILIASKSKAALVAQLPNLDIHLSTLPVKDRQIQIAKLQKILSAHDNIKFIHLNYATDEIDWTPSLLMSLMELCYRYGVLIIEHLYLQDVKASKRQITCKQYDYKHYVISCVHNQRIMHHEFSYIIAHQSFHPLIDAYKKNMQMKLNPESFQFHLHHILYPNAAKKAIE